MRDDVVEARAVIDHPSERVWQVVGRPELYSRFVKEIAWCELLEPDRDNRDRPPEYLMRFCPDLETVVEEVVQAVVFRSGQHVVWSAISGGQRWVSLELRRVGLERTELVVQVMIALWGSKHASLVSSSAVHRRVREAARRINDCLSGTSSEAAAVSVNDDDSKTSSLFVARTLARAGVLAPARPDKLLKQANTLAKWGATIVGGYQSASSRDPERTAVNDEHGSRTFAELEDRSTRLANALAAHGVGERNRIALMCRNHSAMVESMIACGRLGADAILLNTGLSAASVAEVIEEHKPAVVLADDEFAPAIQTVPGDFLRISTWADRASGYPTIDDLIRQAPGDRPKPVAHQGRIVVLTSGTTGLPKGARRRTPKGLGTAAAVYSQIPMRVGERIFIAAPVFHTWGLAGLQLGMPLRATLSMRRKFDPEGTLRAIAEHRCTALFAVPIMLQRILELPERVRRRYDTSCLRIVASSGSALPGPFVTAFMDAFGDVLYNLYGSTEVSWASIANPVDLRAAPTTAGRCPPGTRVGIYNDAGDPVPPGAEGHIFVGNEMLFEGYTNGSTLPTAHKLMATGDRGYLDADGRLFVSGRKDEMIVSGGENVFPRPVEEALLTLPQISDVAVIGVPDNEYGQRLAAYIVLRPGATLDPDTVRGFIHQRLARFAVPRDVYFIPELPRNATGKVLKRLLRDESWAVGAGSGTRW